MIIKSHKKKIKKENLKFSVLMIRKKNLVTVTVHASNGMVCKSLSCISIVHNATILKLIIGALTYFINIL